MHLRKQKFLFRALLLSISGEYFRSNNKNPFIILISNYILPPYGIKETPRRLLKKIKREYTK